MLRRAALRGALLERLGRVDRLVLLGDVLELRHGPVRETLGVSRPVLASIGEALGPGGEVVIVPGNHDHHLLSAWLDRRGRSEQPPPLGLESGVDWQPGEPIADVAQALAPARVRAAYPGVWLRDDTYATHGHYGDRHTTVPMFERIGAGAMARIVGEPPSGPQRAEDYEAILAPIYAWIHVLAQNGGPNLGSSSHGVSAQAWRTLAGGRDRRGRARLRRRGLITAFPVLLAGLNRAGIGPLRTELSGAELRRAALRAFGEVLARLHVPAAQVIFGHTHRAGPLGGDDHAEWRSPTGSSMLNTGCWVHEPGFLGPRPEESPYRAGFCALLEPRGAATLVNLLDAAQPDSPGVKHTA